MSAQDEPRGAAVAELPAVETQATVVAIAAASSHEEVFIMNWFPPSIYILSARRSGSDLAPAHHRLDPPELRV